MAKSLQQARQDYRRAQENCPHWDYECDTQGEFYSCCEELQDAMCTYHDAVIKAKVQSQ